MWSIFSWSLYLTLLTYAITYLVHAQSPAINYEAQATYTVDGFNNRLVYPQCATFLDDGSIAVYHYGAGGVYGQQGVAIFSYGSTNTVIRRSITRLIQSANGPTPPQAQLIFDNTIADSSLYDSNQNYACDSMFTIHRTIDNVLVELIAFMLPVGTRNGWNNQPVLIDRNGTFYGSWSSRPPPQITLPINRSNRQLIPRVGARVQIDLIDSVNQSTYHSIDLSTFYSQTDGNLLTHSNFVMDQSNNLFFVASLLYPFDRFISYWLIGLHLSVDQSTNRIRADLITSRYLFSSSDIHKNQAAYKTLSINSIDQSLMYGDNLMNGSIIRLQSINQSISIAPPRSGAIRDILFTSLNRISGQAVFPSDSAIITFWQSGVLHIFHKRTNSINEPTNQPVTQQISVIPQLTGTLTGGASASLRNYQVTSIYVDRFDRIFLTSTGAPGELVGVLIISRSGEFIDWLTGFYSPMNVFIDRQGNMVVPDPIMATLYVINLSTRQIIHTLENLYLVSGVALDHFNGGYIVSSIGQNGLQIQCYTANYSLNQDISPLDLSSLSSSNNPHSNPVTDRDGRIYILVPEGSSTVALLVIDGRTGIQITRNDFQRHRRGNGVEQDIGATLSLDPQDQSIVVHTATADIFRTIPFPVRAGGGAVGDPLFHGLRGQIYQIHGTDGAVYAIISQSDMQVNARFVFLDSGRCPVLKSSPSSNCWSHPGSYFGEIGIKIASRQSIYQSINDHQLLIVAGPYNRGFSRIELDGQMIDINPHMLLSNQSINQSFQLTIVDAFHIIITVHEWTFEIDNSDGFINLSSVRINNWSNLLSAKPHGLLGQTWRPINQSIKQSINQSINHLKEVIEGEVDDYVIVSNDLFGTDFMYNRYTA